MSSELKLDKKGTGDDGGKVWSHVTIQIHGPLSRTCAGNNYLISMTDNYSKWVEAQALAEQEPETIARFLLSTFTRLGLCQCHMEGFLPPLKQTIIETLQKLGKSLVDEEQRWEELFNSPATEEVTIESGQGKTTLIEKIHSSGEKWDEELDKILFDLRTCPMDSTGEAPFALMHHQRQPNPSENGKIEGGEVKEEVAPKKKRGPRKQPQMFKCELCEEEEFDSEIYFRIHMKAHGSPLSSQSSLDCSVSLFSDNEEYETFSGEEGMATTPKRPTETKPGPPANCGTSGLLKPGRYRLRTNLKPTAHSSLLNHMMNKSRLKRSGEYVEQPVAQKMKTIKFEKENAKTYSRHKETQTQVTTVVKEEPPPVSEVIEDIKEEKVQVELVAPLSTPEPEPEPTITTEPLNTAADEPSDVVMEVDGSEETVFVCPTCGEMFTANEDTLRIHFGCHREGSMQFHCIHCDIITDTWGEMQQHLETHVEDEAELAPCDSSSPPSNPNLKQKKPRSQWVGLSGKDPIVCPQCTDVVFYSKDELEFHIELHWDDNQFHCPFCNQVADNWSVIQKHFTDHAEVPVPLTSPHESRMCKECNKIFQNAEELQKHSDIYHCSSGCYQCEQCGMRFSNVKRLAAHRETHTNSCYECSECQKITNTLQEMLEHQRIHQGLGSTCDVCQKIFPRESLLKLHQKIHRKPEEMKTCEKCGKKVRGAPALRYHMRFYHDETQTWPCPFCPYIGRTKNNLQGHTDRLHNKPYKCSECEYACMAEQTLTKHISMFHNNSNRVYFQCSLCSYRATNAKGLAEHRSIQHSSPVNTFPCPECKLQFKTRALLRDHMPLHAGTRSYVCRLCSYSAKYRPTMYRHILNKHPGQTMASAMSSVNRSDVSQQPPPQRLIQLPSEIVLPTAGGSASVLPMTLSSLVQTEPTPVQQQRTQTAAESETVILRTSEGDIALPKSVWQQIIENASGGENITMEVIHAVDETAPNVQTVVQEEEETKTVELVLVSDQQLFQTENGVIFQ